MPVKACIFDAYGTLFDVTAAARAAASEPGFEKLAEIWPRLAADWRDKQLQYTWLRAVTGRHADFWDVTRDALDWALDAAGLAEPELRERLLALYWELPAFAEVPGVLAALKAQGHHNAILSNGSPDMLRAAIASAGIAEALDAVLSVEDVGVFKPHAKVYQMVRKRLSLPPEEALFVSSNGWDAACATGAGLRSVWVNRTGAPHERLPWRPAHTLPDLAGLPELAGRL